MARAVGEEAAAEAKKAEGASETRLRMPRPPALMGRVACNHPMSLIWMLQMDSRSDLGMSSKSWSRGDSAQGAVLRIYKTLGREKALHKRQRASWA
jgi:hypothetical protein